ncbi:hypothetical protein [Actinoplanes sp. HUAS TT8]
MTDPTTVPPAATVDPPIRAVTTPVPIRSVPARAWPPTPREPSADPDDEH